MFARSKTGFQPIAGRTHSRKINRFSEGNMKDENARPASDVHAGHRERLKKRAQEVGLTALPPHEVIELLLFYAVPRQDVNELAHALIDRFETVTGVLSAGEEELMKVPGVGFRIAGTLAAFFRAASKASRVQTLR